MTSVVDYMRRAFGVTSEVKAVLVGLDGSGRTSALYKWKLGEIVQTIPTIGFNVERIQFGKDTFVIFDVGGCDKIRYKKLF